MQKLQRIHRAADARRIWWEEETRMKNQCSNNTLKGKKDNNNFYCSNTLFIPFIVPINAVVIDE
jgi:hypothetical protein